MSCDCLNRCGDDPWLKDGRSQPCQDLIDFRVREHKSIERAEKIEAIGKVYGNNNVLDLVLLLHDRIVCLTAERDALRTELHNIAFCDMSKWVPEYRNGDDFKLWSQSRARAAISKVSP